MAGTLEKKFDGHFECPSSGQNDVITVTLDYEDKDGNTGKVVITGPYAGINQIDAANPLQISSGNPIPNRVTTFGTISFAVTGFANFDFENPKVSCMNVVDHEGFRNVPNDDATGMWNVIMTDKSTKFGQVPLVTETGEPVVYFK